MVPIVELPKLHGQALVSWLKEPSVVPCVRSHARKGRFTQMHEYTERQPGRVGYGNVTDLWRDGSHVRRWLESKAQKLPLV